MSQLEPRSKRPISLFGQRIRRACDERGMTLRELANKAGISSPHLSDLIHGAHKPQLDTVQRIAAQLDMTVSEITGDYKKEPG